MINISFDNVYLLLIAIPLGLIVLLPFFVAFRKDNRDWHAVVSVVLHLIVTALIALAAAGTTLTAVITETNVYVVADVSYSAHRNLDIMDEYIQNVEKELPKNSKLGVVCFGKDYELLTELGADVQSVKNAKVDDSATNIAQALDYTGTLFQNGVIKRIVLITDGKQSNANNEALVRSIESLYAQGVKIDAMYLDDNLTDDVKEVQISGVEYTQSTYIDHETTVEVRFQSGVDTQALAYLYKDGEEIGKKALTLTRGANVESFPLDTSKEGVFAYEVRVETAEDISDFNNSYSFTQEVAGKLQVLVITGKQADADAAVQRYGDRAEITAYVNDPDVPYTVETLCQYDEIVLSNVDVRELNNFTAFVSGLDKAVSLFGKSLITVGDTKIQNKSDEVLKQLEDMLPVKFGNKDQDPKLVTIVVDVSRSMQENYKLILAKQAAVQLLDTLNPNDYVAIVSFSGEVSVVQTPTKVMNKAEVVQIVNDLQPAQGTFIGRALDVTLEFMKHLPYSEKQVMLISDGMSYASEPDQPLAVVEEMRQNDIYVSVLNSNYKPGEETLQEIARVGGGEYYFASDEKQLADLILTEIADEITETVIEGEFGVNIERPTDKILDGVPTLPKLHGYVYGKAKASATTVLSVDYVQESGVKKAPVYAYWNYGDGKVSSFTSDMAGAWVQDWTDGEGAAFFNNMLTVNTPKEKIDVPYTVETSFGGAFASVKVTPVTLKADAEATLEVLSPSGDTQSYTMTFDGMQYFHEFATSDLGAYTLRVTYEMYEDQVFTATRYIHLSYWQEYDAFQTFDVSALHKAIRHRGNVYQNGEVKLENDEKEVATYTLELIAPFMILAVALFIADVVIRKLKWVDVVSFFKKTGGGQKGGMQ